MQAAPGPSGGIDATIQRIVLDGLDGAACRLHTTREELVLSIGGGGAGRTRHWGPHTIDVALRAGLLARWTTPSGGATSRASWRRSLRQIVQRIPLERPSAAASA